MVEDPPVRLPLSTPRPKMPELVKQQAKEVLFRQALGEREGADGVRMVEGVHQAAVADLSQVDLPE